MPLASEESFLFAFIRGQAFRLDMIRYFRYRGNMTRPASVARYADMFAALGAEPRLRVIRLLLAAHPGGMVASEIQDELGIPASTLSHHLEKLKNEDLVTVERESTFLRYRASAETLRELLGFLYAECCTRSSAVQPETLVRIRK
jgi:ArsR family transcriptional regulator, arsenate/arsenite/antimonite-responsive transcriptional repressor